MSSSLPVSIVSGFPGAGVTTLLNHVLAQAAGRAVVVAEAQADTLANLAGIGQYDCVLVEAGTGDPEWLADSLADSDVDGAIHVDTMVTVVDATNFLREYSAADFLHERNLVAEAEDDRTVADLLIAQIEFCDVIVVNKTDCVSETECARLIAILHALNPRADIVPTSRGEVSPERVLRTGRFDLDALVAAPGWVAVLRGEAVTDRAAAGDVSAFAYRRRRPFHPQRFFDLMHTEWLRGHGSVLRSKGFFWLATRMDIVGSWEQAGGACRHGGAGLWWAATDMAEWPDDPAARADIDAKLQDNGSPAPFGDRMQELALIGEGLDQTALEGRLDACLLTDAEMAGGPAAWAGLADPFPGWEFDDHDHDHDGHDHDHDGHGHVCDDDCDHH